MDYRRGEYDELELEVGTPNGGTPTERIDQQARDARRAAFLPTPPRSTEFDDVKPPKGKATPPYRVIFLFILVIGLWALRYPIATGAGVLVVYGLGCWVTFMEAKERLGIDINSDSVDEVCRSKWQKPVYGALPMTDGAADANTELQG